MYKEKFVKKFIEVIHSGKSKVDPDNLYSWDDIAIGYFMGRGCDIEQAKELLEEVKKQTSEIHLS